MRFARLLTISIAVLLLFPAITAPAYAAPPGHGCAQPVPPIISGSPGPPPATPGIILINEVLNNPDSTWNCSEPSGSFSLSTDSWVELYNPQNQPFNLYEVHASLDNGSADISFHFPFGSDIPAHGYLVVFPETYALSNSILNGNTVRLTFGGTVIDLVSTPTLLSDTSYARIPDGSANWQITTNPTIDTSNQPSIQVTSTPTRVPTKTSSGSGNGSGGYGSTSSAWDMTRRILLTMLVVALALSLFWCWKVFSSG